VYVFTATILITEVVFNSGNIATFTYSGKQPLVNEQFILSGFTGTAAFLNGQTITVLTSNVLTFTAHVVGTGTYFGLSGTGTSTTGDFAGPNLGGNAFVVPGAAAPWVNPNAVYLEGTGYASSTTASSSQGEAPGAAANQPSEVAPAWTNPQNIGATGATVASVTVNGGPPPPADAGKSEFILANGFTFVVPPGATVTGVQVSLSASSSGAVGTSAINVSLASNGNAIGTEISIPISSTMSAYTAGGPTYQWGTTIGSSTVTGSSFGVLVQAQISTGQGSFNANSLVVVVYYTTPESEALNDTQFNFSIPSTSGISGFGVTFQAYSSAATTVSMQLLKDGVPVGNPETQVLTTAPTVYTLGSPFDLWGSTWLASDVNNTNFGVQITASGNGITSIQDVDILTYLTPGLSNFNYIKSYIQNNDQIDTLALDSSGILWKEDVTNNPGVLSIALTGILPGSFAKSATSDDREYIMFSNEAVGTDRPRVYDGTAFYPLSQMGPAAPPFVISSVTNTAVYAITTITQYPAVNFNGQILLWSSGPGLTTPGTTITFYYGSNGAPQNAQLVTDWNSGNPVYVYITGANIANGTWQVQSIGAGQPPSESGVVPFITIAYTASGYARYGGPGGTGPDGPGNDGTFQETLATMTVATPIPNLSVGDTVSILGAMAVGYDGPQVIVSTLNSGVVDITSTAMSATGTATYTYIVTSGTPPAINQLITVTNATNSNIFNTTGKIATSTGGATGTFTITGFSNFPAGGVPAAVEDNAVGVTFGTEFTFDPGAQFAGTVTDPIYGPSTGGTVATGVGVIGAGTRQVVVFFITESGYETTTSPPYIFTVSAEANTLMVSQIPIGPPNVIARGLAFTEAGQNGVPGANFYVIPNPVTIVVGGITTVYSSTIINDNTSTTATLNFTDGVLLNSEEVDIQGNDLFNLIELGSSAWCVPYANRMFYGLQLNKIDNWAGGGLSFDGGYLPNSGIGGPLFPLGWQSQTGGNNVTLVDSPVTGMALYISNTTGATIANAGLMSQNAYLDADNVPIININTTYSIRVACSCPSGNQVGTLLISLVDFNPAIGYGTTYGGFLVPLTSMSTNMQVFTGTLLTVPFPVTTTIAGSVVAGVSPYLVIALQVAGLGPGADCLIDRIEVFPTLEPYLLAQVYGSYVDDLEAVDASGSGGIVDTSEENPQACMGGFVMHDVLYLLKTDSMDSTEDNPSSEPGGWGVHEVSNRVGAIGISSYDTGEEWCITACRDGIYGFNGGQPVKIMQEIWQVWEQINWAAGNTIVLKNDIVNRRILCAVPLATPNQWLPFDPVNLAPTTPNVILMCNYQGLNDFQDLVSSPQMHTTMFGTLAAVDMKRKWSIWHVATPYMDFISRQAVENKPLFVCNGIESSKIYQFLDDQLSDDGVAIYGLYTTYGFVNAAKAATLPIFGFHQKRYTVLQGTSYGAGVMKVVAYQNTLGATYPYTIPGGITQQPTMQGDWFRPLNQRGSRIFLEFSTDAVGSWFNLSKLLLSGKADTFTLNPTGGGNQGFPSGNK
jgi:hypothetical protein